MAFTNSGDFKLNGEQFTFGGPSTQLTGGTTTLANGILTVNNVYDVQGGTFSGPGKVIGNLHMEASSSIDLGAAIGVLQVTGNYIQDSGATFSVKLGTVGGANVADQITVGGNATLAGSVTVTKMAGYVPKATDSFAIIKTTGTVTGNLTCTTAGWHCTAKPKEDDLVPNGGGGGVGI